MLNDSELRIPNSELRHVLALMMARILVAEGLHQLPLIFGKPEGVSEVLILEQAGDPGERFQVRLGGLYGGHEQKEQMDRFAVERIELHAAAGDAESRHQLRHAIRLAVRDRPSLADAGGSQRFP